MAGGAKQLHIFCIRVSFGYSHLSIIFFLILFGFLGFSPSFGGSGSGYFGVGTFYSSFSFLDYGLSSFLSDSDSEVEICYTFLVLMRSYLINLG